MKPKIAIVRFPGTNRHLEASRTVNAAGMEAVLVRWNEDADHLASFDGYVLAGGFSYEDRSRAGIVAALDPVMDVIREQAKKGKAIIGICNGAQMLIESGIVPGTGDTRMCIAESVREKEEELLGTGFINHWVHLKMSSELKRSAFNFSYKNKEELIHCIIAHGEGRYSTIDPNLIEELKKNDQILFQYSTAEGEVNSKYPVNPNGTMENIAGIINPEGNVLALMPHPEQYVELAKSLFESMRDYILAGNTTDNLVSTNTSFTNFEEPQEEISMSDLWLHIRLLITDTEEQTINDTLEKLNIRATVKKFRSVRLQLETEDNWKSQVQELLATGDVCNFNKESVIIQKDSEFFDGTSTSCETTSSPMNKETLFVYPRGNYLGKSLENKLHMVGDHCCVGTTWSIEGDVEAVRNTNILYNIHAQAVVKIRH